MNSQPPIISVQGLVNRFGKQVVHDHLNLEITEHQIIGIVGGSGSGKSVLMRSIVGLHQPNEGDIHIMGRDVCTIRGACSADLFGVLFQHGALFSSLTVLENVMAPLKEHTDLPADAREDIARVKIALTGLPADAADKYPSQLSGGMVKRAALARALALDAPILFLDEPTAGLDPIAAADFDQLIQTLQEGLNNTVLLITHDLDTLFSICHKVAVLVDKKVVLDTVENLLNSTHPWIQQYFNGPRSRAALQSTQRSRQL